MPSFSANLGFLWTELSIPDAIRAAHAAGFVAVECHWPYDTQPDQIREALLETGLPMLGLNTLRGNVAAGENGLSALPGREVEARSAIDQAIEYAEVLNASSVHVMAGNAKGDKAHAAFVRNLAYACKQALTRDITILIEPLNRNDAPQYFLRTTDQAAAIISQVGASNLKLMFDCYHVGRNEGDVITRFTALMNLIGHVQFASVPDRGRPDQGELNYKKIFEEIDALGWKKPLGAEYKPGGSTEETLAWMQDYS